MPVILVVLRCKKTKTNKREIMCWMDEMGKMNNTINPLVAREHHLPSGISVHRLGTCVPSQAVSVRDQLLLRSSML